MKAMLTILSVLLRLGAIAAFVMAVCHVPILWYCLAAYAFNITSCLIMHNGLPPLRCYETYLHVVLSPVTVFLLVIMLLSGIGFPII